MKFNLDMTNVSDGFTLVPEGEYICKVTGVEKKDGTKAPYLNWELTIGTGPNKGSKLYYITTLSPNALFSLRDFVIACGIPVPKAAFQLDTDKIKGSVVGVKVAHEDYEKDGQTKTSAKPVEFYPMVKGPDGWKRKTATPETKKQDIDEDDVAPFNVNDDEIEEVEI